MVMYPLERQLQISVVAFTIVLTALAVLSVLLRIVGRIKLGRWLDASDYVIIAATVAMLVDSIAITNAVFHAGLGFHKREIIERFGVATGQMDFLKHLLVARIATMLSLAWTKISILLLCLRVFTSRNLHLIANMTIGLISLWCIAYIAIILGICTPLAYSWDKRIPNGRCGPMNELSTVMGTINIVADIIVLVLPMPYIYRLQLATYKKVTLMIVFGIGFIVCIASIVKTAIIATVDMDDATWSIQHALILTILEVCLAIIVANIPVLRPLFKNSHAATRAPHSNTRYYSTVPPTTSKGFGDLRNLIHGGGTQGGGSAQADEEPLPMRPEKTYYNRIEALGRGSLDQGQRCNLEMGGITVKTEFTASIEVVEVLNKTARNSVKSSNRPVSPALME